MKKILYFATIIFALALTSCSKEEPGGTETQSMAGEWYVTVEALDAAGNVVELEDVCPESPVIIRTFNTSSNSSNKMYISDCSTYSYGVEYAGSHGYYELFGFYMPLDVNLANGTFATPAEAKNLMPNYYYSNWAEYGYPEYSSITITNGKVVMNGGKQNNGSVADLIEFDIKVVNDYYDFGYADTEAGYYAENNVDHFHVKGVRYSGLADND